MPTTENYPVRVDAVLDHPLSRWLWLVKWLLAIPHFVVLTFLWVAFLFVEVAAFFAILATGEFPRPLFDFNVGVIRWSWRVSCYTNGAFSTDRYPPFTLRDVADYPAHFDVDPPARLSRGLVLVKWWLLAIPHYLIVGLLVGGGAWTSATGRTGDGHWAWGGGGLVGILAVVAAVVLLITGAYPRSLFDALIGLNRWVFRVVAYAALMTDQYPPFRLDLGGQDPGSPAPTSPAPPPRGPATTGHAWTAGRIVALVAGTVLTLASTGPLVGGVALAAVDRTARSGGYLSVPATELSSSGSALVSTGVTIDAPGPDWSLIERTIGTVRVRVTPVSGNGAVFVGLGPTDEVQAYLAGADYSTISRLGSGQADYVQHPGTQRPAAPAGQTFWAARAAGPGQQQLVWTPRAGSWTVAVLNADGSPGVAVRADVGATVPGLGWLVTGLVVLGLVLLVIGVALIVGAVRSPGRHQVEPPTRPTPEPAGSGV